MTEERDNERRWVSMFLLRNGYLLTALEFYQELLEEGHEEVDILERLFSNPENLTRVHDVLRDLPSLPGANTVVENLPLPARSEFHKLEHTVVERNQHIAVLEYEQRTLRDEVESLREKLATVLRSGPPASFPDQEGSDANGGTTVSDPKRPMEGFEKQLLNVLVKQYLIARGYKLAAISLADEAEGDLDDMSSVGLDVASPISLLSLFRAHMNRYGTPQELEGALQAAKAENKTLEKVVEKMETTIEALQDEASWSAEEARKLQAAVDQLRRESDERLTRALEDAKKEAEEETRRRTKKELEEKEMAVHENPPPHTSISDGDGASGASSRALRLEVAALMKKVDVLESEERSTVKVVARALPEILPNVLINKREGLLPIILSVIRQHPESATRDALTHMLFNLIKRPDEAQRKVHKVIMDGCVALAESVGPERTEEELLPQCWEQINHKHPERRVLVAESCGVLAPFVRTELRSSLILSILQQLTDDKSPLVRKACAKNLSALICGVNDTDKYFQILSLLDQLLNDESHEVADATKGDFLLSFADWSQSHGWIVEKLVAYFIGKMESIARKCHERERERETTGLSRGDSSLDRIDSETPDPVLPTSHLSDNDAHKLRTWGDTLGALVPRLFLAVLLSCPTVTTSDDSEECETSTGGITDRSKAREELGKDTWWLEMKRTRELSKTMETTETAMLPQAKAAMEEYLASENEENDRPLWDTLRSVVLLAIPRLLDLVGEIHPCNAMATKSLADTIGLFSRTFGAVFVDLVVRPLFWKALLTTPMNEVGSGSWLLREVLDTEIPPDAPRASRYFYPFLAGVIAAAPDPSQPHNMKAVKHMIMTISLRQEGWPSRFLPLFINALTEIGRRSPGLQRPLLSVVWELIVHPAGRVRAAAVQCFNDMALVLEPEEVGKRVIPALVSLASDADHSVRLAVIRALATVMINAHDEQVLEKVKVQFDALVEDESMELTGEVLKSFGRVIPVAEASIRDGYILSKMISIATTNNTHANDAARTEIAVALIDTFRTFQGCHLSWDVKTKLAEGLHRVEEDLPLLDPSYGGLVQGMLDDLLTPERPSGPERDERKEGRMSTFTSKMKGGLRSITQRDRLKGAFHRRQSATTREPDNSDNKDG